MADFDRVLILETAGKVGQVAIAADGVVVAEGKLGAERRRASDLATIVDRLLRDAGWEPTSLTAVIVGLGPGSYTGLRVGLASAKTLAYAVGCKFFGVETYAAIALRAGGDVSVIGDALKGQLFRREYRRAEAVFGARSASEAGSRNLACASGSEDRYDAKFALEPVGPLGVVSGSDWVGGLRAGQWISGPAAGMWDGKLPADVHAVAAELRQPRPADLLTIARTCPWAVTTDMWKAEPLYLRGSSAEEKVAGRSD